MAKALAENLFYYERRLIRFDMSEFMEAQRGEVDRLAAGIRRP